MSQIKHKLSLALAIFLSFTHSHCIPVFWNLTASGSFAHSLFPFLFAPFLKLDRYTISVVCGTSPYTECPLSLSLIVVMLLLMTVMMMWIVARRGDDHDGDYAWGCGEWWKASIIAKLLALDEA